MVNLTRILCPVDFSDCSRRALDCAVGIARWYGAEIAGYRPSPETGRRAVIGGTIWTAVIIIFSPEDLRQFHGELEAFAGVTKGAPVRTDVVQGEASAEILRFATELPADLVVMATHGRSGFERLMLGSVTEKILRKARCPVLTVPTHAPAAVPVNGLFGRVLCAVDFSPASLRALALARSIAGEAAATLCVMHVLEPVSVFEPVAAGASGMPASSAELQREARHRIEALTDGDTRAFTDVAEVVVSGKPYREILREADAQQADLIVLGAHGGPAGLPAFGSTTNHVVRQAKCPVLTVPA